MKNNSEQLFYTVIEELSVNSMSQVLLVPIIKKEYLGHLFKN